MNPFMDIAARFWDTPRYNAAKLCYQSMRTIDDLIDNHKASGSEISQSEKRKLTATVHEWIEAINNGSSRNPSQKQLIEAIREFQIPVKLWQRFSESMIYDIHHNGFETFPMFLKYAEGAAIAPASIFTHLCGVIKEREGYKAPPFDIDGIAKPAGLFCYLVHIIRDFQQDQHDNLNYFANDLMAENGLDIAKLKQIAAGDEITLGFRNLVKKYHTFAEYHRQKTRSALDNISKHLEPRYRLSLEIVYNLYLLVFERIDIQNGKFTTAELLPSQQEIKNRLDKTISSFDSTRRL